MMKEKTGKNKKETHRRRNKGIWKFRGKINREKMNRRRRISTNRRTEDNVKMWKETGRRWIVRREKMKGEKANLGDHEKMTVWEGLFYKAQTILPQRPPPGASRHEHSRQHVHEMVSGVCW